jgi:glutathione S-transferase
MQLFDNAFSPYAYKVRVALYEKGIDFERRAMRTAAERDALRALNPRDEVPALRDGDTVVYDSTVICEYLEERFPAPPLMPADRAARPSIRQATREMAQAFQEFRTDPDPFFSRTRVHWRNDRVEWALRVGLGPWLLEELDAGRAFFSPVP